MPEFYRISPPPYTTAEQAFSGEGSFNYGGRFNAKNGHHVVYASDSLALAAIETMANVGDFAELEQMVYFKITVEEAQIERVRRDDLPAGWKSWRYRPATQEIGDAWAREARSLALSVPSVVLPEGRNVLINPRHPAFDMEAVSGPVGLGIDQRITRT